MWLGPEKDAEVAESLDPASTATVLCFEQLKIATELGVRGMFRPIQQVFAVMHV